MKFFITGATGFIGNALAHRLADLGHEVVALYRSDRKLPLLQHQNIAPLKGDILSLGELKPALKGVDGIFHLAAYVSVWSPDPADYFRMNVGVLRDLVSLALELKVRRLVFTSSAAVVGPSDGGDLDEESWRTTDFFNPYESSKYVAEERLLTLSTPGLEKVVVLPTRVYGPGVQAESSFVTRLILMYRSGRWRIIPGDGKKIGNYVYIDAVVEGHIGAMLNGVDGERYILGGENLSFRKLFEIVSRESGQHRILMPLPLGLMLVASYAMLFLGSIGVLKPRITPSWVKKYMHNWSLSSRKAIGELGMPFISFEEGVRRTLEWGESAGDGRNLKP